MKKERPVGNALILCAITLVAGLLLSFVNELTTGPIEQAQLAAKAEAYVSVYPDAASFGAVVVKVAPVMASTSSEEVMPGKVAI